MNPINICPWFSRDILLPKTFGKSSVLVEDNLILAMLNVTVICMLPWYYS